MPHFVPLLGSDHCRMYFSSFFLLGSIIIANTSHLESVMNSGILYDNERARMNGFLSVI